MLLSPTKWAAQGRAYLRAVGRRTRLGTQTDSANIPQHLNRRVKFRLNLVLIQLRRADLPVQSSNDPFPPDIHLYQQLS